MKTRKSHGTGIIFQERDTLLLLALFESRIMTAAHIAAIHFDDKSEAAKKRLQKIKAAGFIGERKRRVNEKSILFLTRKGFMLLEEQGALNSFPQLSASAFERRANVSDLTIRHELEVMDVKAAFHSAITKFNGLAVAEFSTWPLLHQFKAQGSGDHRQEILVKPDGFIRIHQEEAGGGICEHTFFLEVDRSSEVLDTLVSRAGCYANYYKLGGFAQRCGGSRADYKEYPFRVLIICKSTERRNNVAERLLQLNPPIFTQVYLSTLAEVTEMPFGKIWIRPIDYRDANKDNAPRSEKSFKAYRRHGAHLKFIENRINRLALLDDSQEEK